MMNKMITALFLIVFLLISCMGPKGSSIGEKKTAVSKMQKDTLNELYRIHPIAKQELKNAKGYAVFSNTGFNLFLLSTGSGWGIAHDNMTGKDTYMKMYSAGVGIGLGVKDFRGIFVFTTKEAYNKFVEKGWQAGAQADAAAKSGEKGGSAETAIDVAPGVKLYQITKNGLALQATIQGTKYWKDDELN
jgi:lipid-binding SYLF domain-containing protein